jgi:hypothetical protein
MSIEDPLPALGADHLPFFDTTVNAHPLIAFFGFKQMHISSSSVNVITSGQGRPAFGTPTLVLSCSSGNPAEFFH